MDLFVVGDLRDRVNSAIVSQDWPKALNCIKDLEAYLHSSMIIEAVQKGLEKEKENEQKES